jgi:hypothetical protein
MSRISSDSVLCLFSATLTLLHSRLLVQTTVTPVLLWTPDQPTLATIAPLQDEI